MIKNRIIHIITGLGNGGAETMLFKLLESMDKNSYELEVISMMDKGITGSKIEKLGIKVHALNMKRGIPNLNGIIKAINLCKNADIIQSWMYHADLFSFIISKFCKPKKLIWGIRRSNLEWNKNKKSTIIIAKINSILSRYVNKIVSCSIVATEVHKKIGFDSKKLITIPNGFAIDKFYNIKESKEQLCKEFNITSEKKIFSLVGRWEVLKDHDNCLKALKILSKKREDFILILCGTNITEENQKLLDLIKENNLEEKVLLLGRREDIPKIMSATDVYISSSSGEGFPNVIGEAMACETICVVTDVGDSAYIVGETGEIVPRKNPLLLAKAIEKVLNYSEEEKSIKQKSARQRIIDNFEILNITKKYTNLYKGS
ncbi:glycosyltransferase [Cetobacterium somerae]